MAYEYIDGKMSNTNYAILAGLNQVCTREIRIFRPDGVLYKTYTDDQLDGVGDTSSFSTSTNFDTPPGSISGVISTGIPHRLVYSRQFMSWKCEVWAKITQINTAPGTPAPTYRKLFTGIIGKATIKGLSVDIEIRPQYDRAKTKSKMILANNCPLEFGGTACGIAKNGVYLDIAILGPTGTQLTLLAPVTTTINSALPYACTIGDDVIPVIGTVLNGSGQLTALTLQRPIIARPDIVFFSRTCLQTLQNCELYQNTANYRGVVLPSSILSITL